MIKNIPTDEEFENLGLQCVTKSFEMLYKLGDNFSEYTKDEVIKEELTHEDFWKHNEITVRTSLIVLYQGVEYLMKMEVTKQSALLLLENSKNDWPTLPEKKDKNFDELQTISGENLLSVFCAIVDDGFELDDFVKEFENIRLMRNKLVHSTGVKNLDYKFIIKRVLFFLSKFYAKDYWIELFRQMFISEPIFGYWDSDVEGANFYRILDFVEISMSKRELNKYLKFDMKARRYLCAECTYWLNKHEFHGPEPKWAFLKPNTPESTTIECLICAEDHIVERKDCEEEDCKGNVIESTNYNDLCLTCFKE